MRIIFDLHGTPEVSASTKPYIGRVKEPTSWRGSQAEVLIVDCLDWDDPEKREEGDAIHIEGNTDSIRQALRDVLAQLDLCDEWQRERLAKITAREVLCPTCGAYADPKAESHSDGNGHSCFALLDERKALVAAEQPVIDKPTTRFA